jgi:hypothetical protein
MSDTKQAAVKYKKIITDLNVIDEKTFGITAYETDRKAFIDNYSKFVYKYIQARVIRELFPSEVSKLSIDDDEMKLSDILSHVRDGATQSLSTNNMFSLVQDIFKKVSDKFPTTNPKINDLILALRKSYVSSFES